MKIIKNHNFNSNTPDIIKTMSTWDMRNIYNFHRKIGNQQTPLLNLDSLAERLGVANIFVKDESSRLGLHSFKPLGSSYAMYKQIQTNPTINTFCTATDGNHGRSVAWMAKKLDKKAVVYVPVGTAISRMNAIKSEGAIVHVVNGTYDETVNKASLRCIKENRMAGENKWSLIQDTAWEGYEEIPLNIMKGYWTQIHEITKQIKDGKIDILILQSGVGSWAASIIGYIITHWDYLPLIISVEPIAANCLFESIKIGKRISINNQNRTIMAGLDCGTVSLKAWKILKNYINISISISDDLTKEAMRIFARPKLNDQKVIAGESGASGLGGLLALHNLALTDKSYKNNYLSKTKSILLINTEGDTDPINYKKIVNDR